VPRGVYPRKSLAERFWAKVDKQGPTDCWEWLGCTRRGYGYIRQGHGGSMILAHRVSWEIANGPIPKGEGYHGICVLHHCDNPSCVNPAHLFLGTHADNMQDMVKKDRVAHPRGEQNGYSILTEQDVHEILCLLAARYSQREIAKVYNVARTTITAINNRRNWSWVERPVWI